MGRIASQITSLTIVYSAVSSGADQRKHQSSASLVFVRGIHRGPVNSPHKRPVTRKMFPFDDVIMCLVTPPRALSLPWRRVTSRIMPWWISKPINFHRRMHVHICTPRSWRILSVEHFLWWPQNWIFSMSLKVIIAVFSKQTINAFLLGCRYDNFDARFERVAMVWLVQTVPVPMW